MHAFVSCQSHFKLSTLKHLAHWGAEIAKIYRVLAQVSATFNLLRGRVNMLKNLIHTHIDFIRKFHSTLKTKQTLRFQRLRFGGTYFANNIHGQRFSCLDHFCLFTPINAMRRNELKELFIGLKFHP